MKIALLTDKFIVGGGLEYLHQIATGLPQHTFVVCAYGGSAAERFRGLPNVILEADGYGPAIVRRHAPDLLHFNHLRPLASHCLRLGPLPLPSLNTVHGIHLRRYDFLRGPHHQLIAFARRVIELRSIAKVDCNIALTESDRDYLVSRLGGKRVVIIPNGISPLEPCTLKPVPRTAKIHFLVPARFDFQKGHDVLLRAIDQARTSLRTADAQFDLLGDGPLRRRMQQLAHRLRIADLVRFHGNQPNVANWMASTDCVILPSRWEGLPFTLLEAGRQARDVICSDACGNIDIADHGRCATLFRNEDPQDLAFKLAAYLVGKGRGYGAILQTCVQENYSAERMLTRLAALYARTGI